MCCKTPVCKNCGMKQHCNARSNYTTIVCPCDHPPHKAELCPHTKYINKPVYEDFIREEKYLGEQEESYYDFGQTGTQDEEYLTDGDEIEKYETETYYETEQVGTTPEEYYEESNEIEKYETETYYETEQTGTKDVEYIEREKVYVGKKCVTKYRSENYQDTENYVDWEDRVRYESVAVPKERTYTETVYTDSHGPYGWTRTPSYVTKTERYTEWQNQRKVDRVQVHKQRQVTKTREVPYDEYEDDYQWQDIIKTKKEPIYEEVEKIKKIPVFKQVHKVRHNPVYEEVEKTRQVPIYKKVTKIRQKPVYGQIMKKRMVPAYLTRNITDKKYIRTDRVPTTCKCSIDMGRTICNACKCEKCDGVPRHNGYSTF